MLGKGIAIENKDFYKLIGKKYLNKKSFLILGKLISIQLGKQK